VGRTKNKGVYIVKVNVLRGQGLLRAVSHSVGPPVSSAREPCRIYQELDLFKYQRKH
jgi:hypothetical protein